MPNDLELREELISDLKVILIRLFFTYDEKDDLATKQKIIDLFLDILSEELIETEKYEELRNFLAKYIIDKVATKFGS